MTRAPQPAAAHDVPHDSIAERCVIGAALLDAEAARTAVEMLDAEDFYTPSHKAAFLAMERLLAEGSGIDAVTVHRRMLRVAGDESVQLADLTALVADVPTVKNVATYARQVRETATLRSIDAMLVEQRAAIRTAATAAEAIAQVRSTIDDLQRDRSPAAAAPGWTAPDLLRADFPDPTWIVPGFIAEGLTLLGGRPKIGKSWLSLALGIAVAEGGRALGSIPVEAGDVLYLSLEDQARRMKKRLAKLLAGQPAPPGLHLRFEWPRLDRGGLDDLDRWLEQHPARLVIIDTLARVRPPAPARANGYADDYAALTGLKAIADRHALGLVVVTHLRKAEADDPIDMISGTLGLTGAADGIAVLQRGRSRADATLFVTGRDVEEREDALHFDPASALWTIIGEADAYRMSAERQAVITALEAAGKPVPLKELAEALGRPPNPVKALVWKMVVDGQVTKVEGRISLPHDGQHGQRRQQGNDVNEVTNGEKEVA